MARMPRLVTSLVLMGFIVVGVQELSASAAVQYRLQLDARPPSGEPWSFPKIFPRSISVHSGDVIRAAWAGVGTPHTATVVPSGNAQDWRAENQGPGGPQNPSRFPYALQVPDAAVGGDDNEVVINPAVAAPSDPSCGSSASPCSFDGSAVVSSGFQFSNPGSEPSFYVKVDAPVGQYAYVCLVHPGMQSTLRVVGDAKTVLTPSEVAAKKAKQVNRARSVDGPIADDLAQSIHKRSVAGGHTRWTMWAGGFWNQVSADEYPDQRLRVHVGDRVRILGNFEIHTATFPASSAGTVPFTMAQCEVPGADPPASSPASCSSPSKFQIAFNPKAVLPTSKTDLTSRGGFVNSGVLAVPRFSTFVAKKPGHYSFVCLVHGPQMSGTIRVRG